jgi:diguanylate cyclase (GGDEF)-like protein
MANFDGLTELPNRNQFHDFARSMIETCTEGRYFAVHFIDLDYFKQVNDTLVF